MWLATWFFFINFMSIDFPCLTPFVQWLFKIILVAKKWAYYPTSKLQLMQHPHDQMNMIWAFMWPAHDHDIAEKHDHVIAICDLSCQLLVRENYQRKTIRESISSFSPKHSRTISPMRWLSTNLHALALACRLICSLCWSSKFSPCLLHLSVASLNCLPKLPSFLLTICNLNHVFALAALSDGTEGILHLRNITFFLLQY